MLSFPSSRDVIKMARKQKCESVRSPAGQLAQITPIVCLPNSPGGQRHDKSLGSNLKSLLSEFRSAQQVSTLPWKIQDLILILSHVCRAVKIALLIGMKFPTRFSKYDLAPSCIIGWLPSQALKGH